MKTGSDGWKQALLAGGGRSTRRRFLLNSAKVAAGGSLAAMFAARGLPAAFAQGTPGALNFPELKVSITDNSYELSATSVPAGLILLTVTNNSKQATGAAVLGPGPGQTMQQLQQAAATPAAANESLPPFLYSATVAGGPGELPPGGTAQAIIKLAEGDWVAFGEGNQPPTPFTATAAQQAQVQPTAAFTVTEVDFAFGGFGKSIAAGKQLWEVVNQGTQPHMLILNKVPANTTFEQVLQVASLPDNATPPPGGLQMGEIQPAGGVLLQSPGTTVWPLLDLPAGRYAALCFVGDPNNGGMPHAMEGMIALFDAK